MLRKMSPCVTLTRLVMFALFAILTGQCFAQNPSKWLKEEKTAPLRGTSYLQFSLDGQFLTPPRNTAPNTKPTMILRCTPSSFSRDHLHGKLMSGYIFVGAVVETRESSLGGTRVDAKFRLDDGKLQTSPLSHSRDFSSIYLSETDLNTLLYGHFMFHKANTTTSVKKAVIGIDEYLGGEVVMQFDFPSELDEAEVADACGVLWHK